MTREQLALYLKKELSVFPGQSAVLVSGLLSPEPYFAHRESEGFPSASLIKTPILLATLEQVRQGVLTLSDRHEVSQRVILPDSEAFEEGPGFFTLYELLYWMVVSSDNTATNVVLDLVGFDAVNAYCAALGLTQTVCQRKMLDFEAARAGRDNRTSAADQCRLFCLLKSAAILSPDLRRVALSILCRQRSTDCLLRYLSDDVPLAHKTGGLDGVAHDCGLFLLPDHPLFVGVFTWDGPSPDGHPGQKQFIGRLGKAIFDVYKKEV